MPACGSNWFVHCQASTDRATVASGDAPEASTGASHFCLEEDRTAGAVRLRGLTATRRPPRANDLTTPSYRRIRLRVNRHLDSACHPCASTGNTSTRRLLVKQRLTMKGTISKSAAPHRWIARKPEGGYCLISGTCILAAWWALRERNITIRDLRVWLASFEFTARRDGAQCKFAPRPTHDELAKIAGLSPSQARRSLQQLERTNLLTWSPVGAFPMVPLPADHDELGFIDWVQSVENQARPVPVPRRTIRNLARANRKSVFATMFAHLMRCMYYRRGRVVSGGRCKATWAAEVFGIHLRTVKAARRDLERRLWLIRGESSQYALNRWGPAVIINLRWRPSARSAKSPPPARQNRPQSPPPILDKKLFYRRSKNQEPPIGRCDGVRIRVESSSPSISRVHPRDLEASERIEALRKQAIQLGLMRDTSCDRLRFHGAAEHARTKATSNPPGLFMWLIRQRKWSFITQEEEDRAVRKIKELDFGIDEREAA